MFQKSVFGLVFCRNCSPGVRPAAGIEAVVQKKICFSVVPDGNGINQNISLEIPAEITGRCVIMQSEQFELLTWTSAPDFRCVGHLFYIADFLL